MRTGLPQPVGSATYNAANQILTWGTQSPTHDLNGNLTSDGVTTYAWDARNQLGSMIGPGLTAVFQYDALGRRSAKTINGATTQFLYDRLNPVQELSGPTVTANLLTGLGIDEYFNRTDAAGARTLLTDALGSTLVLADAAGTVQTQYTYEPFGATTATGAPSANAFQFTGRENDGTGLYYYRARYYHPSLGRFISEDPLGFGGGDANFYAYTFNSPTNLTDPDGQNPWVAACLLGAGLNLGGDLLAGRKLTLGSGLRGCAAGLVGAGLGRALAAAANAAKAAKAAAAAARAGGGRPLPFKDPGLRDRVNRVLDDIASGVKRLDKDGSVFGNKEGLLPKQPPGYYREYTVPTPGVAGLGAQRVVTGAGGEAYFTPNHYRSFVQIAGP